MKEQQPLGDQEGLDRLQGVVLGGAAPQPPLVVVTEVHGVHVVRHVGCSKQHETVNEPVSE